MKLTMALGFAMAVAGCGYGQTKMAATCPPTGCGNNYAAATPTPAPVTTKTDDSSSPVPADADLPPDRTPATDALPETTLTPLPDRALPPPIVPPVP